MKYLAYKTRKQRRWPCIRVASDGNAANSTTRPEVTKKISLFFFLHSFPQNFLSNTNRMTVLVLIENIFVHFYLSVTFGSSRDDEYLPRIIPGGIMIISTLYITETSLCNSLKRWRRHSIKITRRSIGPIVRRKTVSRVRRALKLTYVHFISERQSDVYTRHITI